MEIFSSWLLKTCFYIILAVTVILSLASFYGLMAYLLPVKIILILIFLFFQAKKKKLLPSKK